MMTAKKLISLVLSVVLAVSLCIPSVFAADEVFSVELDSDNGTVDVLYKNPAYTNRDTGISITDSDGDIIYANQAVTSSRGQIYLTDIALPKSGKYTVTVWPKDTASSLAKQIEYSSAADTAKWYKMLAVDGTAAQLSAEWTDIASCFGIESTGFDYITDMSAYYAKLVANRPSGLGEMTSANIAAIAAYASDMALFCGIEQCSTAAGTKALITASLPLVAECDSALSELWAACSKSEYYDSSISEFISSKGTVNTVNDLVTYLKEGIAPYNVVFLLESIANVENSSEIADIIANEENAKALGISGYMTAFNNLNSKSTVLTAVAKSFDSASDFAAAFKTAVETQQRNESSSSSPSSSGGKGGSGSVQITAAGANSAADYASQGTASANDNPFVDIAGVAWAQPHILNLYSLGVVNGKTATQFYPNDYITREEVAKLMVVLMKLGTDTASAPFTDVAADAWYAPYVAAAAANSIVKGMGDGTFGVGLNATKQDIAVMISNALFAYSGTAASSPAVFADSGEIASYAASAVDFLSSNGIITGDESGFFNPTDNATRAQVAVMLSKVYNTFLKGAN